MPLISPEIVWFYAATLFVIFVAVSLGRRRRVALLSLSYVTFVVLFLYQVGIVVLYAVDGIRSSAFFFANSLSFCAFSLGVIASFTLADVDVVSYYRRAGSQIALNESTLKWFIMPLFWASTTLVFAYFGFIGGHVLLSAALSALQGASLPEIASSVALGRKELSAGLDGYVAPGYIKQFRDVIIPLTAIVLMLRYKLLGDNFRKMYWVALLVALFCLLGSAQRSPIVLFIFALACAQSQLDWRGRSGDSRKWTWISFAAVIFLLLTILLGRSKVDVSALTLIVGAGEAIIDRIVLTAPRENHASIAVWGSMQVGFGELWLDSLKQILPGTQSGITNLLHSYIGGSAQGNSPLNLWLSAYMNFGMQVTVGFAFLYGILLAWFDRRYHRSMSMSIVGLAVYSMLISVLPIVTQPIDLLIKGAAVFVVFYLAKKVVATLRFSDSARSTVNKNQVYGST